MKWKYFAAWFPMVVIAVVNGALRELVYRESLGEVRAHQFSSVTGIILLGIYIWFLVQRWNLPSPLEAVRIGCLWLGLTVAFEFGFGHFVIGRPWPVLFHDYNLLEGRVWAAVLLWVACAPLLFYHFQRNSTEGTRRFPWDFFALAFGFSWLVWLPAVLGNLGFISHSVERFAGTLSILGLFGPMFGACILIYRDGGWRGIGLFLQRVLSFRFRARWWCAIVLLPISIQAAAHYLPQITRGAPPPPGTSSPWGFLTALAMTTLLGGGQEEIGWRGYALDRIQSRFSALSSSLILGMFWACWHIPLWLMPGTSMPSTPFMPFVLALLALSVILTWIYNNTGKSVGASMLTHGTTNAAHALFPIFVAPGSGQPVYTSWALVCALVVVLITTRWGAATLARRNPDAPIRRIAPP